MHLAEVLSYRPVPGAAVFLAITRRCPLRCRHCSTDSAPGREQHDGALFHRFVATFTAAEHPEFLLLTGGEPLLRPGLVARLAATAHTAGTRTYLLTGMFFARAGRIPARIRAAIDAVDHLAASLDAFHEEQVPREQVFRAVRQLLDRGTDTSFQVVGTSDADPYIGAAVAAIRREFGSAVPVLVGHLAAAGRASGAGGTTSRAGTTRGAPRLEPVNRRPVPCTFAAWPVVGYDGTVTACCNQHVVDHRPLPVNLRLGHIAVDGWPTVRRRCLGSPVLTALRGYGPLALANRYGTVPDSGGGPGYCETCWALPAPADPAAVPDAGDAALEATAVRLQVCGGPVGFVRRYGSAQYADQVLLGYPERPATVAACPA